MIRGCGNIQIVYINIFGRINRKLITYLSIYFKSYIIHNSPNFYYPALGSPIRVIRFLTPPAWKIQPSMHICNIPSNRSGNEKGVEYLIKNIFQARHFQQYKLIVHTASKKIDEKTSELNPFSCFFGRIRHSRSYTNITLYFF